MNKVILIGRLARDPELRTTPTNLSVATFTIAISRPFNSQNGGNPETDFINCVVWRKQAENLARYCHKGSQIAVEGRIQTRNYQAQDGTRRYVTEVLCDSITFLGSKSDNQGNFNSGDMGGNSYSAPVNNNYQNYQPNYQPINSYQESVPNYEAINNYQENTPSDTTIDNNLNNTPTTDISLDPFKDFGEEITLTDDDLPF